MTSMFAGQAGRGTRSRPAWRNPAAALLGPEDGEIDARRLRILLGSELLAAVVEGSGASHVQRYSPRGFSAMVLIPRGSPSRPLSGADAPGVGVVSIFLSSTGVRGEIGLHENLVAPHVDDLRNMLDENRQCSCSACSWCSPRRTRRSAVIDQGLFRLGILRRPSGPRVSCCAAKTSGGLSEPVVLDILGQVFLERGACP